MTIREYISQKLPSFNLTEAQFADINADFGLDVNQALQEVRADPER